MDSYKENNKYRYLKLPWRFITFANDNNKLSTLYKDNKVSETSFVKTIYAIEEACMAR